ncbi:hypothetical protein FACS1894151_00590 [Spirochaetia bacterium]|nr:hypothetical protein FACS1894151_00590 [Spirochaetia bacterium]
MMSIVNVPELAVENQLYLERPRIARLLGRALRFPVITVTAGAGYGKTHAVYSYIHQLDDVRIVWVQLTEQDNSEPYFWETFLTALQADFSEISAILRQRDFPGTERKFENYVRTPRTFHYPDKKSIFIFDDFHLIHNREVLRFIEHSISLDLVNISTFLISRSELPFNLMVFESKGQLARITEENLKFSKEEMLDYFHLLGKTVDPEGKLGFQSRWDVPAARDSIYNETEGWPFAIYLALRSFIHALPGSEPVIYTMRSNIFKLIESEIISALTPAMRKFLIKLTLVDYQPVKLLLKIGGDRSFITGMEQIGSFIQYNNYSDTYHIHTLLLEYLRTLQNEISDEEKQEVFLTAGRWYLANKQNLNAIMYFEKAGNYDEIIDLIRNTQNIIISESVARLFLEIMNRAPKEIFKTNYRFTPTCGRIYVSLGMLNEGEALLRAELERLEKIVSDTADSLDMIYWSLCSTLIILGSILRNRSLYTGKYHFADCFQRAAHYAELCGFTMKPPLTVANLRSYVCRNFSTEKGEIEKYLGALEESIPYMEKYMGGCGEGAVELGWGELFYFRGNLSAAEENLLKAVSKAGSFGQYEIEFHALFYLVRLYINQGNYEKIEPFREQFKTFLEKPDFINRHTYYDVETGWICIHLGCPELIASWLKSDFEASDFSSRVHGLETLVKAKYHFIMREFPAALAALKDQESRNGPWNCVLGRVELKVLEAVCYYKMGSRKESFESLDAAWEAAETNELYMPFIELGKDMRSLTKAALEISAAFEKRGSPPGDGAVKTDKKVLEKIHLSSSAYSKRLSLVAKQYQSQNRQAGGKKSPVQELSHREQQILISLSQGLTREEIAAEIDLSINTVKSIIKRIYNKLGAMNRADAIRVASDLGLLGKIIFK